MSLLAKFRRAAPSAQPRPGDGQEQQGQPKQPAAPVYAPGEERPRTLWRAICFAGEPLFSNSEEPAPNTVPRGLLVDFQKFVSGGLAGWSSLLRDYSSAETPEQRLGVAKAAMLENGLFLARSSMPGGDPAQTAAMKLFGRSLMAGASFVHLATEYLRVDIAKLEEMPFVEREVRYLVTLDEQGAKQLAATAAELVEPYSGFRLLPLVAMQLAMVVRPSAAVLMMVPDDLAQNPADLAASPFAPVSLYVVRRVERLANEVCEASAKLDDRLRRGHFEAAVWVSVLAASLKREMTFISKRITLPADSPEMTRLAEVRNKVARSLARDASAACAASLVDASRSGLFLRDDMVPHLMSIAGLLRSAGLVAKSEEDKALAAASAAKAREALERAYNFGGPTTLDDVIKALDGR